MSLQICSCKSDNVSRQFSKCWKIYCFGAAGRINYSYQDSVIVLGKSACFERKTMTHSKPPIYRYCRNFALIRAMLIALTILPAGCNKDEQQASKAPPAQPPSAQSVQPA